MKRLIIDMDDVMADTTGQFINFYQKEFGTLLAKADLDFKEELEGFPTHHREAIHQYTLRQNFFRTLEVKEFSQEIMKELNQKYELFIVSAAIEFPNSLTEKLEWLREHFPFLHWKQIVFCGSKAVVHGDYMIDDMAYNLEQFNGKKYIYTAPHNLQHKQFERLNNWKDIGIRFLDGDGH